jgi:hypothetical protein
VTVERLRRSNPRFQTLGAEVRNRVVTIVGDATREDAVMDLARAVSRLSGVERVRTKTDGVAP